jgi:hypothetical protein
MESPLYNTTIYHGVVYHDVIYIVKRELPDAGRLKKASKFAKDVMGKYK